jgi:putative ABC transport system permease protein
LNAAAPESVAWRARWRLFRRLIIRPLFRDRPRTALTVLSIALGVAVVVAIDLAGRAAAGSFESSVETLSGKATLTISGIGGIDEKLLGELVQLPYPLRFDARIEDFATPNGRGAALPFVGFDLISHSDRAWGQDAGDLSKLKNPIFVGAALGWRKGQTVRLLINDKLQTCTVAGILPRRNGGAGENNAIVADIGVAQLLTGKLGRLDSIAVSTPESRPVDQWAELLRRNLPASASVERTGARTDQNLKMLAAFRWNLRILSYIALVVGAFLIYNTVAVSVTRRRPDIGIVRALGATRGAVLAGFLLESAVFGVVGSMAGLLLGRLFAVGAVKLIGSTVEMLYVSSQPAPIQFTGGGIIVGMVIGIGVSIVSALAPAIEASRVSPVEAMARGRRDYIARIHWRRFLAGALSAALLGIFAANRPSVGSRPIFGYLAAVLFVVATALIIPIFINAGSQLLAQVVQRKVGGEAFLALRSLRGSLQRTSVLTAALATAIAMMASVGIMVGSFRETVAIWMDAELKADLYLRPAGSSAADRHPTIDPAIADKIERIPGIAAVDRFRVYPISYQGLPASLGGGETRKVQTNAATYFLPGENRSKILNELPRGDNVIVSEPFANKHNVSAGSVILLPLGETMRRFRVLGIYYDYSTERGFVVMDRRTLLKYLPDPAASNLAVYLEHNANPSQVRSAIDGAIGKHAVMVFTNAKLRRDALQVFDRTFQITWALEVVAIIVAVIGIAGALLALVIDRKREYALLRFLGANQLQIRRIILAEAGFLGIFANIAGIALGIALSLVLIFVINKQSFGWTIRFHWPVTLLLLALTGVYLATLLAGLYPARTAVRMNPIDVIHEE